MMNASGAVAGSLKSTTGVRGWPTCNRWRRRRMVPPRWWRHCRAESVDGQ